MIEEWRETLDAEAVILPFGTHLQTMLVAVDCRYIRERPSGIGAYVEALALKLPGYAPSRQFVLWRDSRARGPLSTAGNVREVTIRVGPNSPLTILWPSLFTSLNDYELFHNPHNILPRGVRCPAVVTVHDVLAIDDARLHRSGLNQLKGLYYPQAVWRALTRATRLIVPSVATADRVATWLPDAVRRTDVIPMAPGSLFKAPHDLDAARRLVAERFGIEQPYVLVVGENNVNTSHSTAVAGFAQAAAPPYRLVLLQRLGKADGLKRLAAVLGIADRVVWLSGASRADVVLLMQGAQVLLQPSRYEGFGLPVIEAMACGCPVIASDIPALREVSGGAAVLVPAGDTNGFARALRNVLASSEHRRSLREAGLDRARAFSWDRTVRETAAVYDDVLRRPAAHADRSAGG
jgi:glycosyltransferase involved in cell wall biosynthesis